MTNWNIAEFSDQPSPLLFSLVRDARLLYLALKNDAHSSPVHIRLKISFTPYKLRFLT